MHWYIHRRQYNGQWSAVSLIIQGICAPFSYSEIIYEKNQRYERICICGNRKKRCSYWEIDREFASS